MTRGRTLAIINPAAGKGTGAKIAGTFAARMANAGLSDLVRFIGLEVCTRKAFTDQVRNSDVTASSVLERVNPPSPPADKSNGGAG